MQQCTKSFATQFEKTHQNIARECKIAAALKCTENFTSLRSYIGINTPSHNNTFLCRLFCAICDLFQWFSVAAMRCLLRCVQQQTKATWCSVALRLSAHRRCELNSTMSTLFAVAHALIAMPCECNTKPSLLDFTLRLLQPPVPAYAGTEGCFVLLAFFFICFLFNE